MKREIWFFLRCLFFGVFFLNLQKEIKKKKTHTDETLNKICNQSLKGFWRYGMLNAYCCYSDRGIGEWWNIKRKSSNNSSKWKVKNYLNAQIIDFLWIKSHILNGFFCRQFFLPLLMDAFLIIMILILLSFNNNVLFHFFFLFLILCISSLKSFQINENKTETREQN